MTGPYVYIAASSGDMERVLRVRARLQAAGFSVTSRWIDEVQATGANPVDGEARWVRADNDVKDVSCSQLLWFLVPTPPLATCGAYVEFGIAKAKRILRVSSGTREALVKSVFTSHSHEFLDDDEAFSFISSRKEYRGYLR